MIFYLTSEAMVATDKQMIAHGVPAFTLMENAGRESFRICSEELDLPGKSVLIVCGKGNNGGDGFVLARYLADVCSQVTVLLASDSTVLSGAARQHYEVLEQVHNQSEHLAIVTGVSSMSGLREHDIVVDALLGTGVSGELREPYSTIVTILNTLDAIKVALDIPTGLNPNTGACGNPTFIADFTIAMAAPKIGLVLGESPDYSGGLHVAEIGIAKHMIQQQAKAVGCATAYSAAELSDFLPTRPRVAHKYSVGMCTIIGGSKGMSGAPVIASLAAARVGAGAVTCATPAGIQDVIAEKLIEVMTLPIPETGGEIDADAAMVALDRTIGRSKSILIGNGLGRTEGARKMVQGVLRTSEIPVVVDADGLAALPDPTNFTQAKSHLVLTPHEGELKQLVGEGNPFDRMHAAADVAKEYSCTVVSKGRPSIVVDPQGAVFLDLNGSPSLATAGAGDCLAGCIAGFLAQGLSPTKASLLSLYLGGAIARRYEEQFSGDSMMAMDIVEAIPTVIRKMAT